MLPGGEQFECRPQQTILNAAHAANILMPYSCRSGQCGSCMGRLIAGKLNYCNGKPDALSAAQAAAGYALFCSAYAESDLSIELIQPDFDR